MSQNVVERVARALMEVKAYRPASLLGDLEVPVLAMDPDFDDLPLDHTQGTDDDEITREAVMRLARAAIAAMRDPSNAMLNAAAKSMSPGRRPTPERVSVREKHRIRFQAMIDECLVEETTTLPRQPEPGSTQGGEAR